MSSPVLLVKISIDEFFKINDSLAVAAVFWECLDNSVGWFRNPEAAKRKSIVDCVANNGARKEPQISRLRLILHYRAQTMLHRVVDAFDSFGGSAMILEECQEKKASLQVSVD